MQAGSTQGRMFARLQVGSGLWLFVRWPQWLVPLSRGARAEPAGAPSPVGGGVIAEMASELVGGESRDAYRSGHRGEHRAEKPKATPCKAHERTCIDSHRSASERWLHGCEQSLLQGVELEVLGVWG
jgi:hypothetical protein